MNNPYCEALGIKVPVLEELIDHRQANTYSLMIVALLEQGGPMTLAEVAERFAEAGIAPAEWALRSLKRCQPARAPVYRDGSLYALDPYDGELDLWAFRLGLRPPKVQSLTVMPPRMETPPAPDSSSSAPSPSIPSPPAPPQAYPLPGPEVPLTIEELEQAWRDASLYSNWSAQRVALAVIDAHGRPMAPAEVLAFINACTTWHIFSTTVAEYWHKGAAIRVRDDGNWVIAPEDQSERALHSARSAVRALLKRIRLREAQRPDPAITEARIREMERRREAHAAELARLSRVVVHCFPAKSPKALVLVDVGAHRISTFLGPELDIARRKLARFDVIAAVEVRALLRALDFEHGKRRLAELGPPQKSKRLNKRGRTLKITTDMLIRGSCGISSPLGEKRKLQEYLRNGQTTRLRRRLEADAKSLFALYEYGRLHKAVRLRWGFLDETISAPWVHWDELGLGDLKRRAYEHDLALEVVIGSAPGWAEPWARARLCWVEKDPSGWGFVLLDEDGFPIDECDVQLARVVEAGG